MKELPILMNGSMVCATLAGDKTATRRTNGLEFFSQNAPDNWRCMRVTGGLAHFVYGNSPVERTARCPYGQAGDHLWVREAFSSRIPPEQHSTGQGIAWYRATSEWALDGRIKWKPSIHMPRWACRIVLEVVDVRVERLQDGEGETAWESRYLAEGIHQIDHGRGEHYYSAFHGEPHPKNWADPFDARRELWVSTGGNWNSNPWVWAVKFRRIKP